MRNKTIVWTLVAAMLLSSLLLAAGPLSRASADGTNLALGKTVTASGQAQTYSPDNVKDGNPGTYWESTNNAFPQWIQVDLGASADIDRIVLKLPAGWEARTQTLAVQGSADGATFTDIVGSASYAFNPSVAGNSVTIDCNAASTRYVRLYVTANTGWPAAQLSEFEIYGSAPEAPSGTYEAEAAALSGGAKANTDHTGYSGTGFVDGYWTQGAATTFTVDVPEAGGRNVTLTYGNASGGAKTVSIYVNGVKIRQTTLANLANWDTWGAKVETLDLNAGTNTIAFQYDAGDSGNVNLDRIEVDPDTTTPPPTDPPPTDPPPTEPPSGDNVAIGKSMTASSSTFTYEAANANDNDVNTYWEGGGNPSALTLDLGANYNVTSIVLKLNPDPIWAARTQTIQVLGRSQNATSYSNLVSSHTYSFDPASGNSVTIPVTATASSLQLNITANTGAPAGQIAEFQVFGSPAPNPDLTVTNLTWSPTSPDETSAIALNATVHNIGTASSAATAVSFYLNGEPAGTASVGALAAGASATVSVDASARAAGTYSLSAIVDESDAVIEQNEGNNSYASPTSLVVAPIASSDLTGTVSWTPSMRRSAVRFLLPSLSGTRERSPRPAARTE